MQIVFDNISEARDLAFLPSTSQEILGHLFYDKPPIDLHDHPVQFADEIFWSQLGQGFLPRSLWFILIGEKLAQRRLR